MPAAATRLPAAPALSVDYVAAPGPEGLLAPGDVLAVFGFGDAAPAALDGSRLAGWWIGRSQSWLALVLVSWTLAGFLAAVAGSRRSVDV